MSLSTFSLAEPAIAQVNRQDSGKKAPPKRTTTAIADSPAVPEPR